LQPFGHLRVSVSPTFDTIELLLPVGAVVVGLVMIGDAEHHVDRFGCRRWL
jgi:hypothetical protein